MRRPASDRDCAAVRLGAGTRLRVLLGLGFFLLALALGALPGSAARAQDPPADTVQALRVGKMLLESSCTNCHHHLRSVDSRILDRTGWEKVADAMKSRGAIFFRPQERGLIVDYLVAKSTFEAKCATCHPIDRALAARKSGSDWRSTVRRMAEMKPGTIGDAEARSIADYLTLVRPAP